MADQQKHTENLIIENESNKTDPIRPTFENGQVNPIRFFLHVMHGLNEVMKITIRMRKSRKMMLESGNMN